MLRITATIIVPLLLPTFLYLLWLVAVRHLPLASAAPWRALPWPWLAGAGLVLAAAMLYAVGTRVGGMGQGVYVPPQWIGGKIVPGHVEPATPARP
jgi:hypothetical protein